MKPKRIEALDLVGLAILERQTTDPKERVKVAKAHAKAVKQWKEQHWQPKCPHCGRALKTIA